MLAAGFGTRLRPITDDKPKCLVEINNRPLLAYWLDALQRCGITDVLINLHYQAEKVEIFLEQNTHAISVHLVYETQLLGTAGTIRQNKQFFDEASTLVAHADNFCLSDLDKLRKAHATRPQDALITMMTFETLDPKNCGIVEVNAEGLVIGFHEKVENPPGNVANAAVYIFEAEVIDNITRCSQHNLDISLDVLPRYIGRIQAWPANKFHIDIGTLPNLKRANDWMM